MWTPFPKNTMFIKPTLEKNRRINQKIQKTKKEKEATALNSKKEKKNFNYCLAFIVNPS